MTAGHCKNVRGAIYQRRSERLAPQVANIHAFFRTDLHSVQARWLSPHRMHTCRKNFDIFAVANEPTKKPFRNRAPTNIASANEENGFHGAGTRGASALFNLEANESKSIWAPTLM